MASNTNSAASEPSASKDGRLHSFIVRAGAGIVYAVVFIGSLILGVLPTAVFTSVMSWLCCYEFYRMARIDGKVPNEFIGLSAAVLFPLSALVDPVWLTVINFLLVLSLGLWYVQNPRTRIADVAVTVFGPIYTGYMLSAIVLLREAVPGWEGALLSVGVCASLWLSDSFAYMVGSRFGKHKMAPKISPKKSWEGFFGGLAGSIVVWLILWSTDLYDLDIWFAIMCGIVVSIMGVFRRPHRKPH